MRFKFIFLVAFVFITVSVSGCAAAVGLFVANRGLLD